MSAHHELVESIYAAHGRGEFKSVIDVLHPDVVWRGVEGRGENGDTACCNNRSDVVARLARLYERGRRFRVIDQIESDAGIAVGIELADPTWPAAVTVWKLFTIDAVSGQVIRMQDCAGRDEAVAALAAL